MGVTNIFWAYVAQCVLNCDMYTHKIWVWTIDNKKGLQGSTNQLWTLRTWYGLVRKISSATVWRLEVFPSWSGPQDISCEYLPKKSLNGGSFYHSYTIKFTNEECNHDLILVHYIKGVYGIILCNSYHPKSFFTYNYLTPNPKVVSTKFQVRIAFKPTWKYILRHTTF